MSKSAISTSTHSTTKTQGRSKGALVQDPVLKDTVTQKVLASRQKNNPDRY
jgi:hypothetical protein